MVSFHDVVMGGGGLGFGAFVSGVVSGVLGRIGDGEVADG
jgi:hypothetical protein